MAIYVKFDKPDNIRDFLKLFFTVRRENDMSGVTTYSDPECTVIQCRAGKWRSFEAVVEIVQTYFPEAHYIEIFQTLLDLKILNQHNETCYLYMMSCGDIRRINLVYSLDHASWSYLSEKCSRFDSEMGWIELLEQIGITNKESYLKMLYGSKK